MQSTAKETMTYFNVRLAMKPVRQQNESRQNGESFDYASSKEHEKSIQLSALIL
jgi:hypothetical protein